MKLIEACARLGEVERSYSGRGMYGATCVGVVVAPRNVARAKRLAPGASVDNMGLDAIVYWPAIGGAL